MAATFHRLDPFVEATYQPHGHTVSLSHGLDVYAVGQKDRGEGIILLSDIQGINIGRIKVLGDFFAANGYYVVVAALPPPPPPPHESIYHLSELMNSITTQGYIEIIHGPTAHNFKDTSHHHIVSMIDHMHDQAVSILNLVAFGWSTWLVARILGHEHLSTLFRCGVLVHPCLHMEASLFGGDLNELLRKISRPILFVLTQGDSEEYLEGGAVFEPLKYRVPSTMEVDFPYLNTGFILHEDIDNTGIFEAIKVILDKVLEFIHNHHK